MRMDSPVNTIYVEEASDLEKELYVGMVIDRSSQSVVFMASTEGGVNIEEVAAKTPHLLHKVYVDALIGGMPYQGRELAFKLGLNPEQTKQFTSNVLPIKLNCSLKKMPLYLKSTRL